eukprot:5279908-Amphidinium_carterae.1
MEMWVVSVSYLWSSEGRFIRCRRKPSSMLESPPILVDPDPVGILSRPYRLRNWGRGNFAHPSLVEGYVLYAHECGCYPRSIVPRFVDVGTNDPVAMER